MSVLPGGCHCGKLRLEFLTARVPADTAPRACDCSFCTRHGAGWVSDPAGRLDIVVTDPARISEYRQGSNQARFIVCADCGVLVAACLKTDAGEFAAVNFRCLDAATGFAPVEPASPQSLGPEEKSARWRRLWIGDVRWTGSTHAG